MNTVASESTGKKQREAVTALQMNNSVRNFSAMNQGMIQVTSAKCGRKA